MNDGELRAWASDEESELGAFEVAERSTGQAVMTAIEQASPGERSVLIPLLGFQRFTPAASALVGLLDDADADVRQVSADALGKLLATFNASGQTDESALESLRLRLDREELGWVLSTVVQALALGGQPDDATRLQALVNHPDAQVRRQAEWGASHLATTE